MRVGGKKGTQQKGRDVNERRRKGREGERGEWKRMRKEGNTG